MLQSHDLAYPMLAMLILTLIVWVFMFYKRIPWITAANLTPEQSRSPEFERLQPSDVINPASNFKNLFEVPVLFYVVVLFLMLQGEMFAASLVLAWLFVASRYVHSAFHCLTELIMFRFFAYLFGVVSLIGLTATAFLL